MTLLVIDDFVLLTRPSDENSENGFRATDCLEQNRRFIIKDGKRYNDTEWMMKILPHIAKYFKLDRKDILKWWAEEYGIKAIEENGTPIEAVK